jgi:tetratricopeptide (TPR) repeat protein
MRTRFTSFVIAILLVAPLTALAQTPSPGARERARVPYRIGLDNFKVEAWDEAVKAFKEAVDIDPAFEMAYYMLGRTHMAQKKYADASTAYEKCRGLYQQQGGRQYANANERQRNRDTQLREIDEMIRLSQSQASLGRVQDAILQLQNRRREIEEAMSRGNTTMTLNLSIPAYVSMALGSAYFRMGKLAEAEKEYRAAIEADGKAGEAYSNLAVVLMETGRLDDAEKSIKAAENVGFKVHPQLKEEIKNRRKAGTN